MFANYQVGISELQELFGDGFHIVSGLCAVILLLPENALSSDLKLVKGFQCLPPS